MLPMVKAKLLEGKKGLIVGIANENSIAWGCAKAFRAFGAEVAVTYVNDKARKYVEPLAREVEAPLVMPLDVNTPGQMEAVFERIAKGGASRTRGRRVAGRIRDHHGCFLLDLHSHGTSGGAPDAQGRHAVHDVILRQPDGR